MTTISSLPNELLLHIFDQLDGAAQIAECRLVCKTWNALAERAMLKYTVVISSNDNKMKALYNVLKKDPTKGQLIKHLHFNQQRYFYSSHIAHDTLRLAFTPSIQIITGIINDYNIYGTLISIVKHSPKQFDKLKVQHLTSSDGCEFPLKLLLHFKASLQLQSLRLSLDSYSKRVNWSLVNELKDFPALTTLTLIRFRGTLANFDKVLDSCPHLEKMHLFTVPLKSNQENLRQAAIRRNTKLKMLTIAALDCSPEVLEYLLYKFTNLESVFAQVRADFWWFDSGLQDIIRIVNAIKKMVTKKPLISIDPTCTLREEVVRILMANGHNITIDHAAAAKDDTAYIKVHIQNYVQPSMDEYHSSIG